MMKANEVRKLSSADLEKKLTELKKDLFNEVKRDIARVKTIIREQQLAGQ